MLVVGRLVSMSEPGTSHYLIICQMRMLTL